MNRPETLERVRKRREPWDIIVIGGGATGVGCALDAASRGYAVLLLEQHDFGKGTSSRSTKLIHGGVRYLRQGNIALVRESLRERAIMLRNAPHIVHKQEFVVPCYSTWQKLFYGIGLKTYDLLSGKYSLGRSRILSRRETLEKLVGVNPTGLSGSVLYLDGQFDDTRLLIDAAGTAYDHGAALLNYTRVTSVLKAADGKVNGVEFEDADTGENITVTAKAVINATGAFCDAVREMSNAAAKPILTLSQGIHLVFDRAFMPCRTALMIPKTKDGRVLFCIPWHAHTLIGTTDTPVRSADLEPEALDVEIDFVLETASRYLARKPTRNDILSVFAGIRPLVRSSATDNTASLSRGHTIEIDASGLLTITGGKWTTYRRMAEDAVDGASRLAGLGPQPSITETLPITGPRNIADSNPLHPDLTLSAEDVLRAVREEMAQTVEDVLGRRTRALFLNAAAAIEIAPAVAKILADELGKDELWCKAEVEGFTNLARRYLP